MLEFGPPDAPYVLATDGDSDFATLNWKSPTTFQATKVSSPTYSGCWFYGNGTSYLELGIDPKGVDKYSKDDTSFGVYSWDVIDISTLNYPISQSTRIRILNLHQQTICNIILTSTEVITTSGTGLIGLNRIAPRNRGLSSDGTLGT